MGRGMGGDQELDEGLRGEGQNAGEGRAKGRSARHLSSSWGRA